MKKDDKNTLFFILLVIGFFLLSTGKLDFLQSIISPSNLYNSNMESWCVNSVGGTASFGVDENNVSCSDSNSVLLYDASMIPKYWALRYGVDLSRTTDSYEGLYAAHISKTVSQDWVGVGMTDDSVDKFVIPVSSGRSYNISFYYTLHLSSGRSPIFYLRFFDVNKVEIQSARISKELVQVSNYSLNSLVGEAPVDAVSLGWNVWIPPETVCEFDLDYLLIDEAGECVVGQTESCGVDVGECSVGTRTCNNDSVWGECSGVLPTYEVCSDSLDNDCDGFVDEDCDVSGFTRSELIQKFDAINQVMHNGQGTSDSNSPTWWAWDNAPIVESYINMYLSTNELRYLDSAITNTDVLISKASDSDGDGLLDWEALEPSVDPILTYGRTLLPMLKLAYVIEKRGLSQYSSKAEEYVRFVEDNFIPLYEGIWVECGDLGFWSDVDHSAPNNRAAFVGRSYVYLYMITGNQMYYERSVKYANKIKSTLTVRSDDWDGTSILPYYFWQYHNKAGCQTINGVYVCSTQCSAEIRDFCPSDEWTCVGPAEMRYANYELMLMLDYYELGIVFNSDDLNKLINTFNEGILIEEAVVDGVSTPVLNWKLEPEPPVEFSGHNSQTAQAFHWPRLGHYNSEIKTVFDKIIKFTIENNELNSDYYSAPYLCVNDLRGSYGELCASVTEKTRSSPAATMSMIGHQMLASEPLSKLSTEVSSSVSSSGGGSSKKYADILENVPEYDGEEMIVQQTFKNKKQGLLIITLAILFIVLMKKKKYL